MSGFALFNFFGSAGDRQRNRLRWQWQRVQGNTDAGFGGCVADAVIEIPFAPVECQQMQQRSQQEAQ